MVHYLLSFASVTFFQALTVDMLGQVRNVKEISVGGRNSMSPIPKYLSNDGSVTWPPVVPTPIFSLSSGIETQRERFRVGFDDRTKILKIGSQSQWGHFSINRPKGSPRFLDVVPIAASNDSTWYFMVSLPSGWDRWAAGLLLSRVTSEARGDDANKTLIVMPQAFKGSILNDLLVLRPTSIRKAKGYFLSQAKGKLALQRLDIDWDSSKVSCESAFSLANKELPKGSHVIDYDPEHFRLLVRRTMAKGPTHREYRFRERRWISLPTSKNRVAFRYWNGHLLQETTNGDKAELSILNDRRTARTIVGPYRIISESADEKQLFIYDTKTRRHWLTSFR